MAHDDTQYEPGDRVWFVDNAGAARYGVKMGVVIEVDALVSDENGGSYRLGFAGETSTTCVPLYGGTWRWLFPSEVAAKYQADLVTLADRAGLLSGSARAYQRMAWYYALAFATHDMHKGGRCGRK